MTWPSRFLAVPVSALTLTEPLSPTPKATPEELRSYAGAVRGVYDRLEAGFTEADFRAMRETPLSPQEKLIGDTYLHLYSPMRTESRIEAEFQDGAGLVVTRGRHRFDAARQVGTPMLPVHVRAQDRTSLDRISAQLESEVAPTSPNVVRQHRALDAAHHPTSPSRSLDGERPRSIERGPEPERGR